MLYAGIDMHKEFCQACVVDENGRDVRSMKFQSTPRDALKFFDYLDEEVRIVVEACGIRDDVLDALLARGFNVVLSDPYKNKLIAQAKNKTDKLDARILANLLRAGMIYTSYYPPEHIRQARDVVRHRIQLVGQRTSCKNRIQLLLTRKGVVVKKPFTQKGLEFLTKTEYSGKQFVIDLLETINFLDWKIGQVEKQIKEIGSEIPEVNLLRSVPGIDYFSALLIYSEIGDVNRFRNHKKFAGFTGLVPSIHQSGMTERKGNITKLGSPLFRWILIQATHICIKYDNCISRHYQKIKYKTSRNEKKRSKKAIVAAARKLAVVIYYMLKRNEKFRS
jgi:transposase